MPEPNNSARVEILDEVMRLVDSHESDDFVVRDQGPARQNHTAAYHSGYRYAIQVLQHELSVLMRASK